MADLTAAFATMFAAVPTVGVAVTTVAVVAATPVAIPEPAAATDDTALTVRPAADAPAPENAVVMSGMNGARKNMVKPSLCCCLVFQDFRNIFQIDLIMAYS
jgi:hypothetical protein